MSHIHKAVTDGDIARCFAVMAELRPHLTEETFVARIRRQQREGYMLAFLENGGGVLAVAGYRILENLAWGRFLYVDDLVTHSAARSGGHGGRLLEWLVDQAREAGCDALHLDSGLQRLDAHRFYESHGLSHVSQHFSITL